MNLSAESKHFLKFLGYALVTSSNEAYYLAFEFPSYGLVNSILAEHRQHIPSSVYLIILYQLADVLSFIHQKGLKLNRICPDSVYLTEFSYMNDVPSICIKFNDFDLSSSSCTRGHQLDTDDNHVFRHMAPEAILDGIFTQKSNIWAFAVCAWEIYTGQQSWDNCNSEAELKNTLLADPALITHFPGDVLLQPSNCSDYIWNLVLCPCWRFDSKKRPNMDWLCIKIDEQITLDRNHKDRSASK